jgi:hypothetical protein
MTDPTYSPPPADTGSTSSPSGPPTGPPSGFRARIAGWPPAARVAAGCGCGCAVLAVLLALGLWALLAFTLGRGAPEGVTSEASHPSEVAARAPFPLEIRVRNAGTQPVTVNNVAARQALLDSLALRNPDPAPQSGPTSVFGTTTWMFGVTVPPGEEWVVTFEAEARQAGRITGNIEVQAGLLPTSVPISLQALPPEGAPPETPAEPESAPAAVP